MPLGSTSKCATTPQQPTSYLCADGVPTIRALEKLLLAKNEIYGKEGGEVIAGILQSSKTLKELDVSGNCGNPNTGVPFAKAVAAGLDGANGALTSLNLSKNYLKAEGTKHVAEAFKGYVSALRFF